MREAVSFEVEVRLAAPVALNHPWLHLDGILTHLAKARAIGREQYNQPTKLVRSLPSEDLGPYAHMLSRSWITRASVSFFGPVERLASIQFFKRFEADGFPRRNKIAMGFGHYRSWMMRLVYAPAEWCRFWGRGDMHLVQDLLQDLTHLGGKSRMGWGAVSAVTVRETEQDRSLVWEGRAMRPIPTRFCRSWSDAVPLAWRPPYWAPEHVEMCVPPGAEVDLLSAREVRAVARAAFSA